MSEWVRDWDREPEYWDPIERVKPVYEVSPRYCVVPADPAARRDMRRRECNRPRPGRR